MLKEIVIASKNRGKIKEIEAKLAGLPLQVIALSEFDVPDAEETGQTFLENAVLKAKFYAGLTNRACLADDSGLEVAALAGRPGVYSARYAGETATDAMNNAKLLDELRRKNSPDRSARYRCCLAFVDTNGEVLTADGVCDGKIISAPLGDGGFGYDPLFYLPRLGKTMAELPVEKKNELSHRGRALEIMAEKLAVYLCGQ